MKPLLFLLRRWDDLTHSFQGDGFKFPKQVHAPLTTKQMTARLQEALDAVLTSKGFTLESELTWTRPHTPFGVAVFNVQIATKYAPEFLRVSLSVGFKVPFIADAIETVCGPLIIEGEKHHRRIFSGMLLHRAYCDPDRPKKRLPFPLSFTLWNVDFRESVIKKIKHTIQLYALPYFDRIKTIDDLKSIGMTAESRVALYVWLGDVELALRLLDEELQKPKRYGPEMRARLECLRESIVGGQLQRLLPERK